MSEINIKSLEEALKAQLAQIEETKCTLIAAQREALITEGVTLRDEIRSFLDEHLAVLDVPTLRKIKALMVVPSTTPSTTPTTTTFHTSDEAKAHKRASAKLYILNQTRKDQGLPKVSFADYWAEHSAEFLAA